VSVSFRDIDKAIAGTLARYGASAVSRVMVSRDDFRELCREALAALVDHGQVTLEGDEVTGALTVVHLPPPSLEALEEVGWLDFVSVSGSVRIFAYEGAETLLCMKASAMRPRPTASLAERFPGRSFGE
jgi:hypothetical protein